MSLRWTPRSRHPLATAASSFRHGASERRTSRLDRLLERRSSREPRNAGGRDLDPLAGRRIASFASAALRDAELAEARERDFAPPFERVFDRVKDRAPPARRILLAQTGTIGDLVHEFLFGHL